MNSLFLLIELCHPSMIFKLQEYSQWYRFKLLPLFNMSTLLLRNHLCSSGLGQQTFLSALIPMSLSRCAVNQCNLLNWKMDGHCCSSVSQQAC